MVRIKTLVQLFFVSLLFFRCTKFKFNSKSRKMILFEQHTPEFLELKRKIRAFGLFGGYEFGEPRTSRLWKFYRLFCVLLYTLYFILNAKAIYTRRSVLTSLFLQLAMTGGVITSLSIAYDLIVERTTFYDVFVNFGIFEKRHYSSHFKEAFKKSQKALRACYIFNGIRHFLVNGWTLIVQIMNKPVWTEHGKFNINPQLNFYLPLVGPARGWTTFLVNYAFQFFGVSLTLLSYAFFMIVVSILVIFSDASLMYIIDLIEDFGKKMKNEKEMRYWNRKNRGKEMKKFLSLHVAVIE